MFHPHRDLGPCRWRHYELLPCAMRAMTRGGCGLVIPYWPSNDRPAAFSSWDQDSTCGCSGTGGSGFGGGVGGGIRISIVRDCRRRVGDGRCDRCSYRRRLVAVILWPLIHPAENRVKHVHVIEGNRTYTDTNTRSSMLETNDEDPPMQSFG
jgi:hypothetical protein